MRLHDRSAKESCGVAGRDPLGSGSVMAGAFQSIAREALTCASRLSFDPMDGRFGELSYVSEFN